MKEISLTAEAKKQLREEVVNRCGLAAGRAFLEVLDDTRDHGRDYTAKIIYERDYLVVVLNCQCSNGNENSRHANRSKPIIKDLFGQGVVVYYYHSILEKHHQICLALRKIGLTAGL